MPYCLQLCYCHFSSTLCPFIAYAQRRCWCTALMFLCSPTRTWTRCQSCLTTSTGIDSFLTLLVFDLCYQCFLIAPWKHSCFLARYDWHIILTGWKTHQPCRLDKFGLFASLACVVFTEKGEAISHSCASVVRLSNVFCRCDIAFLYFVWKVCRFKRLRFVRRGFFPLQSLLELI